MVRSFLKVKTDKKKRWIKNLTLMQFGDNTRGDKEEPEKESKHRQAGRQGRERKTNKQKNKKMWYPGNQVKSKFQRQGTDQPVTCC